MQDGYVSNDVNDSPNKISVTQIPTHWNDEQVTELLLTFVKLKAFVVVKDTGTEQSRVGTRSSSSTHLTSQGIAFAEYADPAATDIAVEGLNNMPLGDDRQLRVQRASVGSQQAAGLEMSVAAMSMLAGSSSTDLHEGRVLQMLNMVTADELMDNEEYEGESTHAPEFEMLTRSEICADVHEECSKFGKVLELKIPRPMGTRANPGVGKIFVKFETKEAATGALRALAGRKFSDRTVVVTFFGEVRLYFWPPS
jgi:splicing factor U2AF subunit